MKIAIVSFFLLIRLQGFVEAEVIHCDLPSLQGYYSYYGPTIHRADTLTYSGVADTVRTVTMNLDGRATSGLMECCTPYPYFCYTYTWRGLAVSCVVKRPSDLGDWNLNAAVVDAGDFELTVDFSSSNGFNMLNDGDVLVVDLFIQPIEIPSGNCYDMAPPEATIDQAQLLLVIGDTTPVESASWGRIKALYGSDR